MKKLLSYGVALIFSLSLATATYAGTSYMGGDHKTCCGGGNEKGKKMSKKECKEKCKTGDKKGCCSHSGSTSKN
jgi:hypothetical protein